MPEDNIRGNIGGEAGFVLQDCQGDSVFYFIRKKSAIRIQKNWRHYNDKTTKTNELLIPIHVYFQLFQLRSYVSFQHHRHL